MANLTGLKEVGKLVGLLAGTGVAVAGTYGMAKEAWRSYENGKYGQAAMLATSAGSGACLAGLGIKTYVDICKPNSYVLSMTPEAVKNLADMVKTV